MQFNPERFALHRQAKGMSQGAAAKALGVSQGRISKVENGALRPSDQLLIDAAQEFGVQREAFFGEDVERGLPAISFFRKQKTMGMRETRKTEARFSIIRQVVISLAAGLVELADRRVPRIPVSTPGETPASIAQRVRTFFQAAAGPLLGLTRMMESAGIIIVPFVDTHAKFDAVSCASPDGRLDIVAVKPGLAPDRYRFSIAHELGHLVMHTMPSETIEDEANQFAAELLMPAEDIESDLTSITIPHLMELKRKWQVAMSALIYRAKSLGLVSEWKARNAYITMSTYGFRKKEPVELPREEPQLFTTLIVRHLAGGKTFDDIAAQVGLLPTTMAREFAPVLPAGLR